MLGAGSAITTALGLGLGLAGSDDFSTRPNAGVHF